MEFKEILQKRKSTRRFQDREVLDKDIKQILEMANTSPSAGNLQARSVIIARDKQTKEELCSAALGQSSVIEASVVLVVSANLGESMAKYGERGKNLYAVQDATIFVAYAQLAATSLGLSSVWIGAFNEDDVRDALGLDNNIIPIALLPIGYAAEEPHKTPRKNLDEIIFKEI